MSAIEGAGDAPDGGGGGSIHPSGTNATEEDGDVEPGGGESPKIGDRILVGGEGGDYVAHTLSTAQDVGEAIRRVQVEGGLGASGSGSGDTVVDFEPLLGLLGQLGMTRAEAYRQILDDSLDALLQKIKSDTMSQGTLLSLLDASFRYVTIEELRVVPLAALERLNPVPSSYLKNISKDVELFRRLPIETQRQCWALKPTLLRRHATPIVVNFADEIATVVRNLDADVLLAPLNRSENWSVYPPGGAPPGAEEKKQGTPSGLPRKSLRAASASTTRLRKIVGREKNLYLTITGVIQAHYAEHGLPATCALRSQLLMSAHDDELVDLCAADKCHRLAWLADACVRDRCLDGRRVAEILAIVKQLDFDSRAGEREALKLKEAEARRLKKEKQVAAKKSTNVTRSKGLSALKVTFGMKKKQPEDSGVVPELNAPMDVHEGIDSQAAPPSQPSPALKIKITPPVAPQSVAGNDSENGVSEDGGPTGSISRAEASGITASANENRNPLGGVGMILRDPPVLHLLLHETCRTLELTVEAELVPKKEERLKHLTDLLAVACGARRMTRDVRPTLPNAPPAAMSEFYPILAEMILETMLRDAGGEEEEEEEVVEVEETLPSQDDTKMDEDGEIQGDQPSQPTPSQPTQPTAQPAEQLTPRVTNLARLMGASDVIRKVALTHALRRLRKNDATGAKEILTAAAFGGVPDFAEEDPFAVTLARRVSAMYTGGAGGASSQKKGTDTQKRRSVGDSFWHAAVKGVLIPACVGGVEAHEEVLRLLLSVSGLLSDELLCSLIEMTLTTTRKSRKLFKKRVKHVGYEHEPPTSGRGVVGGRSIGASKLKSFSNLGNNSRLGSSASLGGSHTDLRGGHISDKNLTSFGNIASDTDGNASVKGAPQGGVDGVRATYQLLAQRCASRLTPETVPRLHEYLARRDRKESKRNAKDGEGDDVSGDFRTFSPALTG